MERLRPLAAGMIENAYRERASIEAGGVLGFSPA
jgi:hypothetical protein